jgi:hypothetical protein
MPTVKLQNGKVLLKDGKVSCSCCESEPEPEPDCCMYPADGLGDTYDAADLPDAVTINWPDHLEGNADKVGSGYEGAGGDVTLTVINGKWTLKDTSTDPETVRVVGNCLIRGDGNLEPGDDLVEDQFADELSFTVTGEFTINGTFTRVALCQWTDFENVSEFGPENDLTFLPDEQKFFGRANTSESYTKQDNHNTPVGTYIFNKGQSGEKTMTVS